MRIPYRIQLATLAALLAVAAGASAQTYGAPADNRSSGYSSGTTGADGTSGSNQPITDSTVTTKIKTKLLATKDLKSTGIHVVTKNGMVTLTGSVPSDAEHATALQVVRSVDGVRDVNDELNVQAR